MRGDAGYAVRVKYAKQGKVRWISHRDVARAFERALRIEQLPLAFTLGFSPRPKVSFGLALSTGYESEAAFSRAFKRWTGLSPRDVRNGHATPH